MNMDKIDELLTRGVDKIYPSRELLEKVLRSGKKLKLYQGFDPTGAQLHIGHAVALRKLRQFQENGMTIHPALSFHLEIPVFILNCYAHLIFNYDYLLPQLWRKCLLEKSLS